MTSEKFLGEIVGERMQQGFNLLNQKDKEIENLKNQLEYANAKIERFRRDTIENEDKIAKLEHELVALRKFADKEMAAWTQTTESLQKQLHTAQLLLRAALPYVSTLFATNVSQLAAVEQLEGEIKTFLTPQ